MDTANLTLVQTLFMVFGSFLLGGIALGSVALRVPSVYSVLLNKERISATKPRSGAFAVNTPLAKEISFVY